MASPNATFTELVSTTFRNHKGKIIDNFSKNNALYSRVYKKGQYRREDGGLSIVTPLEYQANSTYQRYSGFDVLNVSQSDVISSAEFSWKQIAVNVVADGLTMRINSGQSAFLKLVKARIRNAMNTFKNNFTADMYGDGTLTNQINGLQALVADAGTGTVGGIDSSAFTFWQNAVQSAAAPLQGGGAITLSATTFESFLLGAWLNQVRGDDKPDLIILSNDYFTFFELSQTSLKRYVTEEDDSISAGFSAMKYKTADVIFDGGSGIPNSHGYMLNTDYIELVVHSQADLETLDETRPYNQDGVVIPVIWQGNMSTGNRRLQLVLKA